MWNSLQRIGVDKLHLRDLNQDHLDKYFGQIRSTCGSNDNPTIPQFAARMNTGTEAISKFERHELYAD